MRNSAVNDFPDSDLSNVKLPPPPPITEHNEWHVLPKVGAAKHTSGLTFVFRGTLAGKPCTILFDTGATFCFLDKRWLERHCKYLREKDLLCMQHLNEAIRIGTANGNVACAHEQFAGTAVIQKSHIYLQPTVLAQTLDGIDLIVGCDALKAIKANLNVPDELCEITTHGKVQRLRPMQDKSGDGHIHSCSVAGLREASTSEVLSPKQAAKLLKQGAASWLMLVQTNEQAEQSCSGSMAAAGQVGSDLLNKEVLEGLKEEFQDVFHPVASCPPARAGVDHVIRLQPGAGPTYSKPYRMSKHEEEECVRQLITLQEQRLIEPSSSPYGAPVLFVQKKDNSLRMCIDYRALNKLTVRDRYPLPRIDDLLDRLHGSKVFSSIDLQAGYHQIRISDEDKPKTAMLTPLGQFQWKVLCFGLTNAPATFQRVMNNIFREHIGKCVLVYLDDILVMSRTAEEHAMHLRIVFELLRQHQLKAKLSKCEFNKPELHFLGHVVGRDGVKVDPHKVAVIAKWPVPKNLKELQAFLGLGNYFRKFVEKYSTVVAPLTALTGKEAAKAYDWNAWGQVELTAFEQLKEALITAPVLAVPDRDLPFQVHTDASVVGTGGVLLQNGRVVAYTSTKFSQAEFNYSTPEQELLALVRALQAWRCYLEMSTEAQLITDHNPLIYLQSQATLSRRQARWMEFLSRFPFVIQYSPGRSNVADPISRNPLLYNKDTPEQVVGSVGVMVAICAGMVTRGKARAALENAVASEPEPQEAPPRLEQGGREGPISLTDNSPGTLGEGVQSAAYHPDEPLSTWIQRAYCSDARFKSEQFTKGLRRRAGVWMHGCKVVVPQDKALRARILEACHDHAMSGHVGITKTHELVARHFKWENMRADVEDYVRHCDACQLNKASTKAYAGKLQPLPIPGRRWEHITMDLIVKLPRTDRGCDSILVFVDRLTKMVHLVPTVESLDAKGFARHFRDWILRLHGMPDSVLSDRGPQFNNLFWDQVTALTGIKRRLSSAYHPQTDGQTERTNRTLEEMLRAYVSPDQSDWDEHLACAEFAINNSWQEAVKNTPFFLNYGMHPLVPASVSLPRTVPSAHDFVEGIERAVRRAKQELQAAQSRMAARVNAHRREVVYSPGDQVLLSTKKSQATRAWGSQAETQLHGAF